MKKKVNPVLQKVREEATVKGFQVGYDEGKNTSIAHIAVRAERIQHIKGIGAKRLKQIEDALFHIDLTEEERLKAEEYYEHLAGGERIGKSISRRD